MAPDPLALDAESLAAHVLQQYAAAVAAKDLDAFMRLYDAQVRVFDAWESWVYDGASAWAPVVRNWFESLGEERVRVTFAETRSSGAEGFAVVSSIVSYAGVSAEGQELRSMQNRISWSLRVTAAGPRIIHEHTSAPIGFKDMKAILRR